MKDYTEKEVREAFASSVSKSAVCRLLGYVINGQGMKRVDALKLKYSIDTSHFPPHGQVRGKSTRKHKIIVRACPVCGIKFDTAETGKESRATCSRACSNTYFRSGKDAGNYKHGQTQNPGIVCLQCGKQIKHKRKYCDRKCQALHFRTIKIADILRRGEYPKHQGNAKKYALLILGHKCSICNRTEWDGVKIPLVLDHIDGKPDNWKVSNIRLVCGNCNMLLPTFAGKNKGNGGRPYRNKRYLEGKSY